MFSGGEDHLWIWSCIGTSRPRIHGGVRRDICRYRHSRRMTVEIRCLGGISDGGVAVGSPILSDNRNDEVEYDVVSLGVIHIFCTVERNMVWFPHERTIQRHHTRSQMIETSSVIRTSERSLLPPTDSPPPKPNSPFHYALMAHLRSHLTQLSRCAQPDPPPW